MERAAESPQAPGILINEALLLSSFTYLMVFVNASCLKSERQTGLFYSAAGTCLHNLDMIKIEEQEAFLALTVEKS